MLEKFIPDYSFDNVHKISKEFLVSLGIKGVLLDIDNTLEPYENKKPSEPVLAWLKSLQSVGISIAFVSNNNRKRVDTFNQELGFISYSRAMKPFASTILKAMKKIGTDSKNTVLIGDQMLTDIYGAHNASIRSILVDPIKDKTDLFTKMKRKLEKIIKTKYEKKVKYDER